MEVSPILLPSLVCGELRALIFIPVAIALTLLGGVGIMMLFEYLQILRHPKEARDLFRGKTPYVDATADEIEAYARKIEAVFDEHPILQNTAEYAKLLKYAQAASSSLDKKDFILLRCYRYKLLSNPSNKESV